MPKIYQIISVAFALVIVACDSDSSEKMGEVNCSVTSENNSAFNGAMIFDRAYIHLNQVEVSGSKNGQAEVATTSFSVPEQFFFIGQDPRQPIKVPIAEATYSNAKVQLVFHRDPYVLQLRDTVYNSTPDGNGEGGVDNGEDGGDDKGNSEDDDDGDGDDDDDGDNDDDGGDDGDGGGDGDNDDDGDDDDDEGNDDDDGDDDDGDDDDDDGRIAATKGKTVNLSDFIINARPSVVLLGVYQNSGKNVRILVALDYNALLLTPRNNLDSLVVRSNSGMIATTTFHPGLWFETIPVESIDKATLINFRGETVLFIHKDFNQLLHDLITSKIADSTELTFEIREGT